MKTYHGRLLYTGWNYPWSLSTAEGEIDLRPSIDGALAGLDGKHAEHSSGRDFYELRLLPESIFVFDHKSMLLEKVTHFGFSNVQAYLDNALVWMSGRLIEASVGEQGIKISVDKSEEVFGVYFSDGNYCRVSDGDASRICKPGTPDTCVFLVIGFSGFQCVKFSGSTARMLLDRIEKKTIRATRIGNCTVLGRKEVAG